MTLRIAAAWAALCLSGCGHYPAFTLPVLSGGDPKLSFDLEMLPEPVLSPGEGWTRTIPWPPPWWTGATCCTPDSTAIPGAPGWPLQPTVSSGASMERCYSRTPKAGRAITSPATGRPGPMGTGSGTGMWRGRGDFRASACGVWTRGGEPYGASHAGNPGRCFRPAPTKVGTSAASPTLTSSASAVIFTCFTLGRTGPPAAPGRGALGRWGSVGQGAGQSDPGIGRGGSLR